MKIGILTHHYVSNYGAFLQAYGLTETISKLYPEATVELINYINIKHFVINSAGWFRFYPGRESFQCWLKKLSVPFVFHKARKAHLPVSPICFTADQINRQSYDAIVVGSDEVWNYQDKKSTAKVKFGHGLTCRHIVAYAPSVGKAAGKVPEYVQSGIQKFHMLSARDEATMSLITQITGKSPAQVLDPTFLTQIPEEAVEVKKPYVLFYYCDGLDSETKDRIIKEAHQRGMAVYGAGECDRRYDALTVDLEPFAWAKMFKDAEYVFTGTFHGTVFSILNKKQFWVHLTNPSRIRKVECLLQELGITNRKLEMSTLFDDSVRIDYRAVDTCIDKGIKKSTEYLRSAISDLQFTGKDQ